MSYDNKDYSNDYVSDTIFIQNEINNIRFINSNIYGDTEFYVSTFKDSNFNVADIQAQFMNDDVQFIKCTFISADFRNSKILSTRNAIFIDCPMKGVQFIDYKLGGGFEECDLTDSKFIRVNSKDTIHNNVTFNETNFNSSNFQYSEFNRCTFDGSTFKDVDFSRCEFENCKFINVDVDFTSSDFTNATFSGCDFNNDDVFDHLTEGRGPRGEEDEDEEYERRQMDGFERLRQDRTGRIVEEGRQDVYPNYRTSTLNAEEYDESNLETCFDFALQMEETVQNILEDPEPNLIFVDELGNPFCVSVAHYEQQITDAENWLEGCNHYNQGNGIIYVRTIISAGAGTGFIPLEDAKAALSQGKSILHIKKKETLPRTYGYAAGRGGGIVSAYHCQEGSNVDVYTFVKCTGPKCKDISAIAERIESEEERLARERAEQEELDRGLEAMRAYARQRAGMSEAQIRQQQIQQAENDSEIGRPDPRRTYTESQLKAKTVPQLKVIANDLGIATTGRLRKQQIINAILESQRTGVPVVIGGVSTVRRRRGPITSCPPDKELVNGRCLKKCRPNQIRNANNRCVKRRAAPPPRLSPGAVVHGRYNCQQLHSRRYTNRQGPPYAAADCAGQERRGNDGDMYRVVRTRNGAYRWQKIRSQRNITHCPPGKELVNGRCLKECRDNQYRHPTTHRCRNR